MSLLKRLFGGRDGSASSGFDTPISPEAPFYAVGDVHGCLGQLNSLSDRIMAEAGEAPIIFVGDYVDRGPDSAGVIEKLFGLRGDTRVTCLVGNHEEMMFSFLDDPVAAGPRWLRYGGLETLASFGIRGIGTNNTDEALEAAAEALSTALGPDKLEWLRGLPTRWTSGNVAVVHAGADPSEPMALQTDEVLKWGHRDFMEVPRTDGVWVLHGHTIVDQANATAGRIAIDTGAYATGTLTAAHVTDGDVRFLSS